MAKITKTQLKQILAAHVKWLNDRSTGKRADLYYCDLSDADLREADLSGADLRDADLRGASLADAELREASLSGADLQRADLGGADLSHADLTDAKLRKANLSGADLRWANLRDANLRGANLSGADLYRADLSGADLYMADLTGAALRRANLSGANLRKAKLDNVKFNYGTAGFALVCPEKGSFTAFKKAADERIVELEVPARAKRSSATTRKCRVSEAKVISITSLSGKKHFNKASARYDHKFIYEVGKTVKVKGFGPDRWDECSTGIHCFITRDEAVNYH